MRAEAVTPVLDVFRFTRRLAWRLRWSSSQPRLHSQCAVDAYGVVGGTVGAIGTPGSRDSGRPLATTWLLRTPWCADVGGCCGNGLSRIGTHLELRRAKSAVKQLRPLNSVVCAMRSSSDTSWVISWFSAWRSPALLRRWPTGQPIRAHAARCRQRPSWPLPPFAPTKFRRWHCARLAQPANLVTSFDRKCQPASIVFGAVDAQTRRQALNGGAQCRLTRLRLRCAVSELTLVLIVAAIVNLQKVRRIGAMRRLRHLCTPYGSI